MRTMKIIESEKRVQSQPATRKRQGWISNSILMLKAIHPCSGFPGLISPMAWGQWVNFVYCIFQDDLFLLVHVPKLFPSPPSCLPKQLLVYFYANFYFQPHLNIWKTHPIKAFQYEELVE